ncbi:MAG: uracil-DNA glycosylase family protein [Thermoanaerobaculia bacterium]
MPLSIAAHVETLFSCRACPRVQGLPVTGVVPSAQLMLVGQAPGPHEADRGRPFAYTAGKRLFNWFAQHGGVSEDDFRARVHVGAVIRCFPGKDANGGDRVPDPDEIARCGVHLDREMLLIRPRLVIAVGTLSSRELVGIAQLKDAVGKLHRAERAGHDFDVIVLPHPSGRSTWLNKPENAALFAKSMEMLVGHRAWRGTFR